MSDFKRDLAIDGPRQNRRLGGLVVGSILVLSASTEPGTRAKLADEATGPEVRLRLRWPAMCRAKSCSSSWNSTGSTPIQTPGTGRRLTSC